MNDGVIAKAAVTLEAFRRTPGLVYHASQGRKEENAMATNPPKGPGRVGAVRDRSQTYNPKTETWTKRDSGSGQFMDQKEDGTPFKGVRKEK